MAQLYSNENFPLPVVTALRELGHSVLTSQEAGQGNQGISDEKVLEFACADNRILLTINRKHFISLHQKQPNHFGIIVCTLDKDFVGQARRIHQLIVAVSPTPGKLLRVNRPQSSGQHRTP